MDKRLDEILLDVTSLEKTGVFLDTGRTAGSCVSGNFSINCSFPSNDRMSATLPSRSKWELVDMATA
jgi:hypothetical protein